MLKSPSYSITTILFFAFARTCLISGSASRAAGDFRLAVLAVHIRDVIGDLSRRSKRSHVFSLLLVWLVRLHHIDEESVEGGASSILGNRTERHRYLGDNRMQDAGDRERYPDEVVEERPEQVRSNRPERSSREIHRPGIIRRLELMRVISADSIAMSVPDPIAIPTSDCSSAGASFIPSPTIATFRPPRWRAVTALFCSPGEAPRVLRRYPPPRLSTEPRSGNRGKHRGFQTRCVSLQSRFWRPLSARRRSQTARPLVVDRRPDDGHSLAFHSSIFISWEASKRVPSARSQRTLPTRTVFPGRGVDCRAAIPRPGIARACETVTSAAASLREKSSRSRSTPGPGGVRSPLLPRRLRPKRAASGRFRPFRSYPHIGTSDRQGSCLVENDRVETSCGLDRRAVANEHAVFRSVSHTTMRGGRGCETERAGARDNQSRDSRRRAPR